MRATRCLSRPSSALARVFTSRTADHHHHHHAAGPATSQLRRLLLPAVYTTSSSSSSSPPSRLFSGTAHAHRGGPSRPRGGGGGATSAKKGRFPRDREIAHELVLVRGDDGRLSEPRRTADVLAGLDPLVSSLVVIAMPQKQEGEEDGAAAAAAGDDGGSEVTTRSGPQYPICRVVDKKALQTAAVEKAKAERKKTVGTKEVEINWAIAPHDLQTKLRQLKGFLAKGLRVQVLMLSRAKRKKRQASKDESAEVLRMVKEAIDEVPGSKEFKGMEGVVGGQARLFWEGPQGEGS